MTIKTPDPADLLRRLLEHFHEDSLLWAYREGVSVLELDSDLHKEITLYIQTKKDQNDN